MGESNTERRSQALSCFGRFRLKLDAKGRLTLPSIYRRAIGDEDSWLVLRPGSEGFVQVIPSEQWQELLSQQRERGAERGRGRDRQWQRRLHSSGVSLVSLDVKGRVTVPQELLDRGGMKRDVLVLGVGKHLELWDPDTFFAAASEHEVDGGEIDDLLYD